MRLFHVSEEGNIDIFNPRIPKREDLDKGVGLVWAIDEKHLPNFLTPRDCPRVTYHIGEHTSKHDKDVYFTSPEIQHFVSDLFEALSKRNVELRIIKNLWEISDKIKSTTLNWSLCRMGYAQPRL